MISEQQVREAVKVVQDPELQQSLLELGMIRDISITSAGRVSLTLALTLQDVLKKMRWLKQSSKCLCSTELLRLK